MKFYLVCLFCAGTLFSFAADTLDNRSFQSDRSISLTPYSGLFEDTTRALTAQELVLHPQWFQAPDGFQKRSRTGIYWVRTFIANRDTTPLALTVSFSNLSFVDLYSAEGDSILLHWQAGTFRPARELRRGDGRQYMALRIPPHTGYTLLIRVYHTKHYWPGLTFYAQPSFAFRTALYRRQMIDSLILGAIAILFLYSLLSWIISFYRPYLWLMIFIGASGMYALSMGGYFIDWLTPESPETGWMWNIHLIHAGTIGALVLLIDFWKMKSRWPPLYRAFKGVIIGLGAISLLCWVFDYLTSNYYLMNNFNLLFLGGCVVTCAYTLVVTWVELSRPQRILGYGYVIYLLAYAVCIVLFALWHEKAIVPTAYLANCAVLCVILVFSIALKEELRQYEKDKNMALLQLSQLQQQQNLVLEDLVQERTSDLLHSNQELVRKQSQLENRNQRIETLMQEVHHRVKNNLQLLYGLMKLQLPDVTDPPARDMLRKNLNRIRAMSIVNEKLYGSDDSSLIRLQEFIRETASHVSMMYDGDRKADLEFAIDDDLVASANFAIPFGLILTELLTNSFKYALPETGRTVIFIVVCTAGDKQIQFHYRDNGRGQLIPVTAEKGFSGLTLVRDLVRQLHGQMETGRGGWDYKILLPADRR